MALLAATAPPAGAPSVQGQPVAAPSAAARPGGARPDPDPARPLEDFAAAAQTGWEAVAADGVKLALTAGGEAAGGGSAGRVSGVVRLEIDFQGHAGYAIARRRLALDLPENYELSFWVRGELPRNNLEVKLLDGAAGGDNVWWSVRRDFPFPADWQRIRVKRRHLTFAWGPQGGGEVRHAAALEIAVSAARGGRGWVELGGFTFAPLPPPHPSTRRPVVTASSAEPGAEPALALDGDRRTGWHSRVATGGEAWLEVDFLESRELGGLAIDWDPDDAPARFAVLFSDDGLSWESARTAERGAGTAAGGPAARSYVWLPDAETRHLRLVLEHSGRGHGFGIRELAILPVEVSASPNAFFAVLARDAPRGSYPRAISGEQALWALVGVDGGHDQGLLDEDGRLEAGSGGYSIEPFVAAGGALLGWSDVHSTPSLAGGWLPVPSVGWRRAGLGFAVTAFAAGPRDQPVLYARYRLRNRTARPRRARLYLVLRPFQVNSPAQFLGRPGGAVEVREIGFDGRQVTVTGSDGMRQARLLPLAAPAAFGAMTFDQGAIVERLRQGRMPAAARVVDPFGYASAALAWDLHLAPGATGEVGIAIPLGEAAAPAPASAETPVADSSPRSEKVSFVAGTPWLTASRLRSAGARLARSQRQVEAGWRARLGGVALRLPAAAGPLAATLRTAFAHILISRDGSALRPGTRAYARSWIRDGALISDALLRLGAAREVREFAAWYAGYQGEDGRVPCCVDGRGADPVPENDSHGELLYLLGNYYRYTGDGATIAALWSHVERAVAYIDLLRQQRRTAAWREPAKLAFFGLLPESISHEGYSARPVHSYWDDFFAFRGLADAAFLAAAMGKDDLATRYGKMRDEFAADLDASLVRTMSAHGIDYLPGSVELGDFDATSTAIALSPGGRQANLPPAALRRTFERYFEDFERRRRGDWTSYTPYELRNVGACVRLGWRDRARQLLAAFVADRRPPRWNQWPEVVWRDPRAPGFLGDLPHAWVAAEYVRALCDLFAYERDADHALVLAAGLPAAWAAAPGGVAVRGLHTPFGVLSYTLSATRSGARLRIAGGLHIPPGGLVVQWPWSGAATVNGGPGGLSAQGELVVRSVPAEVRLPAASVGGR
jgi:F5/8 type C domain